MKLGHTKEVWLRIALVLAVAVAAYLYAYSIFVGNATGLQPHIFMLFWSLCLFPIGFIGWLPYEWRDSFYGWGFNVALWSFYLLLILAIVKVKKRYIAALLYAIFVFLVIINLSGCIKHFESIPSF